MSTARNQIQDLVARFAADVLAVLRAQTVEELVTFELRRPGPKPRAQRAPKSASTPARRARSKRLARRSPEQLEKAKVAVVAAIAGAATEGLTAEAIKNELGLDRKELPKLLAMALAEKAISRKGKKRATRYFAR